MIRLVFQYYKSLLPINLAISICVGLIFSFVGLYGFPISFLSGGYFLSILYYELYRQQQYYFYFNRGVSKRKLYISSFAINTIIGIAIVLMINYAKCT